MFSAGVESSGRDADGIRDRPRRHNLRDGRQDVLGLGPMAHGEL